MARTVIPSNALGGSINPALKDLDSVVSDLTNNHIWILHEGDILFVHNDGVGAVQCDLIAVADKQGRTTDSARAVPAGSYETFGPLRKEGWAQPDGSCHVDVDTDTDLIMMVLRPGSF